MAQCITCGTELQPERAQKYSYCMARECQEKNAKGLTMVAVGMNKAADEIMILDDRTREDLAAGKHRDQRRETFGPRAAPVSRSAAPGSASGRTRAARQADRGRHRQRARSAPARPWTKSQERLALLYNEQGLRPVEIADKLGVSAYLVTQIILAAKNRR
jgi:hypothetical protein